MADTLIQNTQMARQKVDFIGLTYDYDGSNKKGAELGLTDVDGVFDARGHGFIFHETKLIGAKLTQGQKILLERFATMLSDHVPTVIVFSTHEQIPFDQEIKLKDCIVQKVKINKESWRTPTGKITVQELNDLCVDIMIKQTSLEPLRSLLRDGYNITKRVYESMGESA